MSERPVLAWVTDRKSLGGDLPARAAALARTGIDYIQLRENDLEDRPLLELARAVRSAIDGSPARLLINDRFDLALASGADGVHLKSDGLGALEVRRLVEGRLGEAAARFVIGRACHRGDEIAAVAREAAADYVTLSPLNPSGEKAALGLEGFGAELARARATAGGASLPMWIALGGVGPDDIPGLSALALPGERWGLAAVRSFQEPENDPDAVTLARRLVSALSSPA